MYCIKATRRRCKRSAKTASIDRAFKGNLLPLRRASLRTAALHPSWTVCKPDVFFLSVNRTIYIFICCFFFLPPGHDMQTVPSMFVVSFMQQLGGPVITRRGGVSGS